MKRRQKNLILTVSGILLGIVLFFLLLIPEVAGCLGPRVREVQGCMHGEDGKPMADVLVQFWLKEEIHDELADPTPYGFGRTDDEGNFTSLAPAHGKRWKPGIYVIRVIDPHYFHAIRAYKLGNREVLAGTPPRFDSRYWNIETSPLEVEILAGANALDPIVLSKQRMP